MTGRIVPVNVNIDNFSGIDLDIEVRGNMRDARGIDIIIRKIPPPPKPTGVVIGDHRSNTITQKVWDEDSP